VPFTALFISFTVNGCVSVAGRFSFCTHAEILYTPFHVLVAGGE